MQMPLPLTRDVLLIGGGHAHALVLKEWGMNPLPGVRLTVVNPAATAPYSGMLPGHIAGHYRKDDLDIDLVRLARFAGARLITAKVSDIDPDKRIAHTDGGAVLPYDIASIDIGITAEMPFIPGFTEHAIGAKPLDLFADRWAGFVRNAKGAQVKVAVIGGGVAGSEVALAMAHALQTVAPGSEITVIEAATDLTGMSNSARNKVKKAMQALGVQTICGSPVAHINADHVVLQDGRSVASDFTLGAAGAMPWPWLQQTALPLQDGFIEVATDLRVKGYETLFAVGDCAHLTHAPRPKAGVFAVRAAPVLLNNLRAAAGVGSMQTFMPQSDYLKLISLGGKTALAEKFGFSVAAPALWRLKNQIDRTFMGYVTDLPPMAGPKLPVELADGVLAALGGKQPICGGCGSKVGENVLRAALADVPEVVRDDVLSRRGDDAAVLQWRGDQRQVITTDHLRAFTLDPAVQAEITAIHALGDIWSMGAKPQAALANVTLPPMSEKLQARTMAEIMGAAAAVFAAEGAAIVGGHTTTGPELSIGFTITGLTQGDAILHAGAQAGDAIVLTRAIGSGTLLAAEMAGKACGHDVVAMMARMRQPQGDAAAVLQGAHAMTDVTGFGLAGHLNGLCRASGLTAQITWDDIPLYDGAAELSEAGVQSTLYPANVAAARVLGGDKGARRLLHDPQTAGGLLAAVAAKDVPRLLPALKALGHEAAVIGYFEAGTPEVICL